MLIVDDDPVLLRALDRALRRRAGEWDLTFVDGGEKAEQAIHIRDYDVVVTDLRMARPGTQVLACARRIVPRAVRVMMTSDHVDPTAFEAHLVLEKPVALDSFEEMLEAAVATSRAFAQTS